MTRLGDLTRVTDRELVKRGMMTQGQFEAKHGRTVARFTSESLDAALHAADRVFADEIGVWAGRMGYLFPLYAIRLRIVRRTVLAALDELRIEIDELRIEVKEDV